MSPLIRLATGARGKRSPTNMRCTPPRGKEFLLISGIMADNDNKVWTDVMLISSISITSHSANLQTIHSARVFKRLTA